MLKSGFGVLALLVAVFLSAPALAAESTEEEIAYLIQSVADSDCAFERNGKRHNAVEAADHLRLKYRRGKRYANSAENFIDRLASKSSWSSKEYLMLCPGTGELTANAWLHAALNAHRDNSSDSQ